MKKLIAFALVILVVICVWDIKAREDAADRRAEEVQSELVALYGEDYLEDMHKPPQTEIVVVEQTVYVSRIGKKIHKYSNCSGMTNYMTMKRSDAVEAGYSFCKKCYPPYYVQNNP